MRTQNKEHFSTRLRGLVGVARSTLSYELPLPAKDAPVIEAMNSLSAQYPRYGYRRIRQDNGPELVSHAIVERIAQAGVGTSLSAPVKPRQNGTDESFNGKFRDACLWLRSFRSSREALVGQLRVWRRHYNTVRPPTNQDYLTPHEFKQKHHSPPQPSRLTGMNGTRKQVRSAQLIAHAHTEWAKRKGIALNYIKPGKPTQNAYVERFNQTYRT